MTNQPSPIERYLVHPITNFMGRSSSSGMVLFGSAVLSLIIANSAFSAPFEALLAKNIGFEVGSFSVNKPLLLWINDGLMSIFFFVIGLELKREMVAGELSRPKDAVLPMVAGLGGMLVPALIFFYFTRNTGTDAVNGWGIPMATDIAFALGVLYLLGDRVPVSLKVFLTAVAIIDDLGAVTVIAVFYTSDISVTSLIVGGAFLLLMILGNILGARSSVFYGVLGIGGLWMAFLLSGVHATIAAVLAAFAIPATVKISLSDYRNQLQNGLNALKGMETTGGRSMATKEQQAVFDKIKISTNYVVSPLQKLEHALHPFVAFVVMPIFALSNAGVSFTGNVLDKLTSPVALGVIFGLLIGKVVGLVGFVWIAEKLGIVKRLPTLTYKALIGLALLAAIGFTMSLFIGSLAFETYEYQYQAKFGILLASLIAGILGFFTLSSVFPKKG